MRKLIVLATFSVIAPTTLLMVALILATGITSQTKFAHFVRDHNYVLFQALPQTNREVGTYTKSRDARILLVKKFLARYKSPLEPHSSLIVNLSDQYRIDYRLIPAIAMQESTGCKFIPENSYNCWGYGIYGDNVLRFDNYEEGIETVIKGLRKNYYDQGLTTPKAIMYKYTPPSVEIGGPWASGVEYFFNEIEE